MSELALAIAIYALGVATGIRAECRFRPGPCKVCGEAHGPLGLPDHNGGLSTDHVTPEIIFRHYQPQIEAASWLARQQEKGND
jgi:hypothetical protein